MDTVELIIQSSTTFYSQLKGDPNGRFRSWEHCYKQFHDARNNPNADIDYLSLHLAFYLASWGMYRGSSFLLQKDYRIHIIVIKEILKEKYDPLFGIECVELRKKKNQELIDELNTFMGNYYNDVRLSVKETEPQNKLSDTLITKILMGTLGCVPAYDRYFIAGVKNQNVTTRNYNINSVLKLVDFYEKNKDELERARKNLSVYNLPYPQMKMLDMGFWQIGFELDNNKGLQVAH
jgi:hypothetical protein